MTATLSIEERDHLRQTARDVLRARSTPAQVRSTIDSSTGIDLDLWHQFTELGWTGIHVAEVHGGAGCGYVDLGAVLHEVGRAITPSPLLASTVLATGALKASETPLARKYLAALAAGEMIGTAALASPGGSYALEHIAMEWGPEGEGIRVRGNAAYVLDADLADVIVVAARDETGTVAVFLLDAAASGLTIAATPPVDRTRRLFSLAVDTQVSADRLLGEPGRASEALLERVVALGAVAAAADALGAAEAMLERTTAYASERTQFGKPIGSFQAVKHHCANMAIAVETSRSAVGAAWSALDTGASRALLEARIAASYVGPACAAACGTGLVVFGGIGFTWEHDAHLYLKRSKLDEVLFGTPSWHRRQLADATFDDLVRTDSSS